jgi:hypothetical protein
VNCRAATAPPTRSTGKRGIEFDVRQMQFQERKIHTHHSVTGGYMVSGRAVETIRLWAWLNGRVKQRQGEREGTTQ